MTSAPRTPSPSPAAGAWWLRGLILLFGVQAGWLLMPQGPGFLVATRGRLANDGGLEQAGSPIMPLLLLAAGCLLAGRGRQSWLFAGLPFAAIAAGFVGWRPSLIAGTGNPDALYWLTLYGAAFAIGWLRARLERSSPAASVEEAEPIGSGGWLLTNLSALLLGLGLGMSLLGVGRHLWLFGGGTGADGWAFAATRALLVVAGYFLVGLPLRRLVAGGGGLPAVVSFGLVPLGCWGSMALLRALASGPRLQTYLRRLGLDTALHGTLGYDLGLAATVLVLPALALGVGLALSGGEERGSQRRGHPHASAVLLGAWAAGVLQAAVLGAGAEQGLAHPSVALLRAGTVCAGLACVILFLRGLVAGRREAAPLPGAFRRLLRHGGMASLGLAAVLLGALGPLDPLHVVEPWRPVPVVPSLRLDLRQGLLSVQPSGAGLSYVVLNRQQLTPTLAGAPADARLIRDSFALLPLEERAGGVRVLWLGLLTPGRALTLSSEGALRVDRCLLDVGAMRRVEEHLFAGFPPPDFDGAVVAYPEAKRRVNEGAYDLVIEPPVPGHVARIPRELGPYLRSGPTPSVEWHVAEDGPFLLGARSEAWILSTVGIDDLCVGVVHGLEATSAHPAREGEVGLSRWLGPSLAIRGILPSHRPAPIDVLRTRVSRRADPLRARFFAQHEAAYREDGGMRERELFRGLAAHFAAQRPSSPFETAAQRMELDEGALEILREAAMFDEPDPFTRQVWNTLAAALAGKRDVPRIYEHLEPLAEAWGPWLELDRVLARADLESLEPADAVARLEPHLPGGAELRADADRAALRLFAMALLDLGDERGAELGATLLNARPDDRELAARMAPGSGIPSQDGTGGAGGGQER